jgi:hypothetical protein
VIAEITGETRNISKLCTGYLSSIPEKRGITESSHSGCDTHTPDSTNVTFNMGNNITYTIIRNNRIAATLHTLETWFVSGM